MKVFLVITKGEIGGAQSFVLSLAKGLKERGYEVSVAFGDGDFLVAILPKYGINVFRLKSLKKGVSPFRAISFVTELKELIDREQFDVVHLNSSNALFGAISARLARKRPKTVFTVHGLSVLDRNYRASYLAKAVYRIFFKIFFRMIGQVVFVSQYNLEEANRQKIVKSGDIVYNGLDFSEGYFFSQEEARRQLSIVVGQDLSDCYLVGSVGRLAYPKNYEFLISAFPKILDIHPDAKGIIIGEGPERGKYEELIKINDILGRFFLAGSIENAGRLMRAFDLFVLPSIYEGLSISLIEAVSAGISAIASDVGGNREVIGGNNCFRLGDEASFLANMEKVKAAGGAARFKAEAMVDRYCSIYLALIEKKD